jgi:arylamine N-acetyltransferase
MCYEVCELLFNALMYFEFDVSRIPSFVLNKYETDLNRPSNHNILVVKIDNQYFLIDTGFGYNSIR